MHTSLIAAGVVGFALAAAPLVGARAAELKVIAGGGMTAPLKELGPRFERATGHKVSIEFAATPELIKMATSAPFDLAVVPVDVFKNDGARAMFVPGPTVDIARVGFGVAVKAGVPKPDVSTPEALKATLLKAQSIAFLPESAAGAYVQKVFDRLGIAEQLKPKIKPQKIPGDIPAAVAKGDAELGVFLTNVLAAPGVELAGPFPGDLQNDLVFTSSIATQTKEAAAAKAFLDYLKSPEAAEVIKAKGMKAG
jgi:molybdate transport system substrate-binding protein